MSVLHHRVKMEVPAIDLVNSYTCTCPDGYEGTRCQRGKQMQLLIKSHCIYFILYEYFIQGYNRYNYGFTRWNIKVYIFTQKLFF